MEPAGTLNITSGELGYFWANVRYILKTAGALAQATKLEENLYDAETRHRVQQVFENYYGGDEKLLTQAIVRRETELLEAIQEYNVQAQRYGLVPVTKAHKLIKLLMETERREKWKARINAYEKKGKVVSLLALEGDYQEFLRKRRERKTVKAAIKS